MPREPRIEGLISVPPVMLGSLLAKLRRVRLVTDEEIEEFVFVIRGCDGSHHLAAKLAAACN